MIQEDDCRLTFEAIPDSLIYKHPAAISAPILSRLNTRPENKSRKNFNPSMHYLNMVSSAGWGGVKPGSGHM